MQVEMRSRIGRYRVQGLLGAGGMGSVYLAHDDALDRPVAIKILAGDLARHPLQRERFIREARAAAQVSCPWVVTIFEVGEEDGLPFIVMEYVEGTSLAARLSRCRRLDIEENVDICLQTARALEAAHLRGVLHRDIKPDNILLTPGSGVRVTDFGIAKVAGAPVLTRTGEVMGTATYMAPEQALGEPVDGRSDLYSLGCVIYESVTGSPPFESESQVGLIYRHVNETPAPMSRLRPEVPPPLDGIVLRLLAKSPGDRFQSARELADALERFRSAGRVDPSQADAPRVSPPEPQGEVRFVGRSLELQQLQSLLMNAVRGQGSVCFVAGEAGVGKTRLLQELEKFARRRGIRFLHGPCLYREGTIPYLPFVAAIREYFRQARRDPNPAEREAMKEFLRSDAPELRALIPQVGTSIGQATQDGRQVRIQDRQGDRERLFETISALIVRISEYSPLVLFLDDLQWADAASLKLLHYLASFCRERPVLLVGAYRTEETRDGSPETELALLDMSQRLAREGLSRTFQLSRLSEPEVTELLAHRLPGEAVDPDLADRFYRETLGNALFVLELVALLLQDGSLVEQDGIWRWDREGGHGSLPERVRDVLARRVDRLSGDAREILECAAVQGDPFDAGLVSRVLERRKIDVLRSLQPLEARDRMIRCEADGFHFDHPKIQEVIYEGIPLEMRRELHRLVARELKDSGLPRERIVFALAQHYHEAGDLSLAYPVLREASEQALRLHAYEEAECYLGRALSAFPASGAPAGELLGLLISLAETHVVLGSWDPAEEFFARSLALSRRTADRESEARVLSGLGLAFFRQARWNEAVEHYKGSVAICEGLGDGRGVGTGYVGLGNVAFELGYWDEAYERYRSALRVGEESGDEEIVARACNNLGALANARGHPGQAIEWYAKGLASFRETGNELGAARTLHNLGMSFLDREEWERAEQHLKESLEISTRLRQPDLMSITSLLMGDALRRRGHLSEAKQHCLRSLAVFKRRGDRPGEADAYRILGMILAGESLWEAAEEVLEKSLAINRCCGQRLQCAETERAIGQMHLKRGLGDRARGHLERAIAEFRDLGAGGAAAGAECDLEQGVTT